MGRKMLPLAVLSAVVGICSTAVRAGSPLGPPRAIAGHHRWIVDFEYAHQRIDLTTCGKCSETYDPLWDSPITSWRRFKVKDLKSDMFLGSLGYGIHENLDVFVRFGAADAEDEIGPVAFPDCPGCEQDFAFNGGYGFAWGLGTRATFCQQGNLTWGGLLQVTWADPDESNLSGQNPTDPNERISGAMDLDWREIQIAAGPTWQIRDGLCVYGGPFWQYVRGDLDVRSTLTAVGDPNPIGRLDCSHDVKEESEFGGYVGALWDLLENASLYAEYKFSDDFWGIGVGWVWKLE